MTIEVVQIRMHLIRGQKVMLDSELAGLYGVSTKNLNKAVRRNASRLPTDVMFKLTPQEVINFMFQFGNVKSV